MNCYLVGMMFERFCTTILYFVPTQPSLAVLLCDWSIKINLLENHLANLIDIWKEAPMEGSEESCPFGPDWRKNMATMGNSCF